MKLRVIIFSLMLIGLPVFWVFDIPHYLYFLSSLLGVIVLQSVVGLIKTGQKYWWLQIGFFGVMMGISLLFARG